jgi:hypothetical protein
MESYLAANPNSVFYLIEARYDGSGYPCDEAVRRFILEFTIAPQTFDAACRKQTPSDETPCSVDQTGAVHNPDLCCENVSVNDDIDSADLLNFSNAANLNGGYVTTDTSSGTHNGIDYDIKITIQDGAVNLDNDSGNHYIRMEMDELFSRASASTRIRYDWTASANARDGGSSGETGNWNDTGTTGFKVRVGNNLISSGNTYRSSVGSPTTDQGEETFPPTHPEVVYTLKATNLDCTPCTVETETVTVLVVMEDQKRCVAPSVIDGSGTPKQTFKNNSEVEGFTVDTNEISAVSPDDAQTFETHSDGTQNVHVFGAWIKNGYFGIPDSVAQGYNQDTVIPSTAAGGPYGWRSSLVATDLFDSTTISDNTVYTEEQFIFDGTKYVSLGAPVEQNTTASFEIGYHSGGSDVNQRLIGLAEGSNYKIYPATANQYRPEGATKTYFAMLITAKNPDCDEIVRTAIYVRFDDQTRTVTTGCKDSLAINYDADALIADNDECCYALEPVPNDDIENYVNTVLSDTLAGGADFSQIDVDVSQGTADHVVTITFNHNALYRGATAPDPLTFGGGFTLPFEPKQFLIPSQRAGATFSVTEQSLSPNTLSNQDVDGTQTVDFKFNTDGGDRDMVVTERIAQTGGSSGGSYLNINPGNTIDIWRYRVDGNGPQAEPLLNIILF